MGLVIRLVRRAGCLTRQLIQRDRQIAHAFSGRVIDRIRDRRGRADEADLAHALDAERIDDVVGLVDEMTLMSCTSAFTGT